MRDTTKASAGARYTDRNGFGWIVKTTRHREPGLPGEHVLLVRDPANNPSPFASRQWMAPETLEAQYRPADEAVEAVASALAAGALDDLRANQARKRAEGRL